MRSDIPLDESNFSPSDPSLFFSLSRLEFPVGVEGGSPSGVDDGDPPGPVMETTGMGSPRLTMGSAVWSSILAASGGWEMWGRGGQAACRSCGRE